VRLALFGIWVVLCSCGGPGGSDGGTGGGGSGAAACTAVKSPPNLVANSSFECGSPEPDAWFARDGALALVSSGAKEGQRAVQLTVPASGATDVTLAYSPDVATGLGQSTYCATAWMKGTVPDARLILRRVKGSAIDDFTFSAPIATEPGWVRLPPSLRLEAPGNGADRLLLLAQSRNGQAGQTLLVDDVDVWISTSGRCDETR
jgi:hypothetical protein